MNNNFNRFADEDNLDDRNVVLNPNANTNINIGGHHSNNNNSNDNNDDRGNRILNFVNNPREAMAKEMMIRAEEKITGSGWFDKCKCKLEYIYI